jgi:membrane-bound lytic murein transglycosylase B
MQKIKLFFGSMLSVFLFISMQCVASNQNWLESQEVKSFIAEMVKEHHFNAQDLKSKIAKAKIDQEVLANIAKPREKLPWYNYEPIFITSKRIDDGVAFWKKNATSLAQAQKKYGVPPEMIVAILGVETFYGQRTGKHNVFDSLVTLAFHYPPRAAFFRSELKEFLVLARDEKWDVSKLNGSYAGAMGAPQFISSSYRRFAVDANNKGKRDLNNMDDAIASVANYFKLNGWQAGQPVVFPAIAKGDKFSSFVASKTSPKPSHSLAQWHDLGIEIGAHRAKTNDKTAFALVSLEEKDGPAYWLGAENFYVITRYNHSDHYAMAAYLLSQKVKEGYSKTL